MSTSAATSFRHRLQRQQNSHNLHIQTQNLPWPGGGAVSPEHHRPTHTQTPLSPTNPSTSTRPAASSTRPTPASRTGAPASIIPTPASTTIARPPLSPRCYSAAAATGQSRFVEGSMNDRVSAVPPAGFLGLDQHVYDDDHYGGGGEWSVAAGQLPGVGVSMGAEREMDAAGRYHLRRPRSTAGWVRPSGLVEAGVGGQTRGEGEVRSRQQQQVQQPRQTQKQQQLPQQPQQQQRGGVVKKTSFLAPLWDGVKEKLFLNKSKSSGSIGRVVGSVVGVGGGGGNGGADRRAEKERERAAVGVETREREKPAVVNAPVSATSATGYPSREEVLESYKNLVASGFFEAHAIRGGRHPLRTGAAAQEANGKSFAEHMAAPGKTAPAPGAGRSFADHMAAQQSHQRPVLPFQPPPATRHSMPPPPPPPRGSSQGKPDTLSSPQRGTKRGASLDLATDAEMVTRKLVKKLRHSASRISMELTGARDSYSSYGTLKARPTTSWAIPGALSPTSATFSSSATSAPPMAAGPAAADDNKADTQSIRHHGKLSKPKDGRRRRIMGLTRRHRSPTPAEAEEDPDTMMIDEPEPEPAEQHDQGPKSRRNITPPSAAFRSHYHNHNYQPRMRTSSATSSISAMSVDQPHEPLSVVPDPNQGIPFVPRIPREFCEAMAAMVPVVAAGTATVVVVGGAGGTGGGVERKKTTTTMMMMMEEDLRDDQKGAGKTVNRDSGLGDDVENIPVWG